jgi:hypothetical protein
VVAIDRRALPEDGLPEEDLQASETVVTPIVGSVEVARTPRDVFAYLDDLDKHGEWQEDIVSSKTDTAGPVRVGTRATDRRRMPGGMTLNTTYEVVQHDPPNSMSFRIVNGPVRPAGTVRFNRSMTGGGRW